MGLFALNATREFGVQVARHRGMELAPHEERNFEDGEHKSRPLVSVRGRDCYVIHSLHGDPDQSANDKLCRLLFFIGALRDAGAARVTAVVPYLATRARTARPRHATRSPRATSPACSRLSAWTPSSRSMFTTLRPTRTRSAAAPCT